MATISSKNGTGKPFLRKHRKALTDLYSKNGVGRTAKQRHAFWIKKYGNVNITHVDPNDSAMRVKVIEFSWLTDNFPQDFTFC